MLLQLVEAELLVARDQPSEAEAAYERARDIAARNGLVGLSGLAAERLARLAAGRGRTLVAHSAFAFAREAYDKMGATAVVLRVVDERSRRLGPPASDGADASLQP